MSRAQLAHNGLVVGSSPAAVAAFFQPSTRSPGRARNGAGALCAWSLDVAKSFPSGSMMMIRSGKNSRPTLSEPCRGVVEFLTWWRFPGLTLQAEQGPHRRATEPISAGIAKKSDDGADQARCGPDRGKATPQPLTATGKVKRGFCRAANSKDPKEQTGGKPR